MNTGETRAQRRERVRRARVAAAVAVISAPGFKWPEKTKAALRLDAAIAKARSN